MLNRLYKDTSVSAIISGFIAVLVGFASAIAIVFQAAIASGATQSIMVSWVWALGVGMGSGSLILSIFYRVPIIIAWSTPGAALIASSLLDGEIEKSVGAFIFVGILIIVTGISGWFDKLANLIPLPLASAMLAGILLQFGLSIFTSMETEPQLVGAMLVTYLLVKMWLPRYAIIAVLITGFLFTLWQQTITYQALTLTLATPEWVTPSFDFRYLVGIGIPLFIVTMTSQNLPGVATLRASGYHSQPISPVITSTGGLTLLLAPFGGFTFNLAAITAAICASDECHTDKNKRYIAGVSAGIFNIIAGIFGATVIALFAMFPHALVAALAGLALLGTIGLSLNNAVESIEFREPALITLLVTASGVTFFEIASAFWGILLGMLALLLSRKAT